MSSKYLYCSSNDCHNHANFRVNFPEPVVIPKNAQIRLINCRLNLEDEDVVINELNNHLLFGLGNCWSSDGSSGVYEITIPLGTYKTSNGSNQQHINFIVQREMNEVLSNMRSFRGGITVSVSTGKLLIKCSNVAVPNDVNSADTASNWRSLPRGLHQNQLNLIQVNAIEAEPMTGGGANNWGNYVRGIQNADRCGMLIGDPVSAPISNGQALSCKINMANFDNNQPCFLEIGLNPAQNTYKNATRLAEVNLDDWIYFRNGNIGATNRSRGMMAFQIYSDGGGTYQYRILRRDRDGVDENNFGMVETDIVVATDVGVYGNSVLEFSITLQEAIDSRGFRARYLLYNHTPPLGPGTLHSVEDYVPNDFYSFRQGDGQDAQSSSSITFNREVNNPSGIVPYVYLEGNNQLVNSLWVNCAWDDNGDGASSSTDPFLPMYIFGNELDANETAVLGAIAPFNGNQSQQILFLNDGVADQLGFSDNSYFSVAQGHAFGTGITLNTLISERADNAIYYLECPDLPVKNYSGAKNFGRINNIIGVINLKEKAKDNLYPGEQHTECYVDLHNTFPLNFTNLTLRIVDINGQEVVGLEPSSIINLHIRQDPFQKQAERLAELLRPMMVGASNDNAIVKPTITIGKMGQ